MKRQLACVLAAGLLTGSAAAAQTRSQAPAQKSAQPAPQTSAQSSDRVEVRAVMAAYNDVLAADPRLARARLLVSEGSPEAVIALNAYVLDRPRSGEAWYLLGVIQSRLEDHRAAAAAFTRAVELKPALRILLEEAKRRGVPAAITVSRDLARRNLAGQR